MRERRCRVAVIGAGTAGLAAQKAAAAEGADTVLIERGRGGTTCARIGCMPSKLLIAAGRALHGARHADLFGIRAGPSSADGRAVMARLRRERDRFVSFVDEGVDDLPAGTLIRGAARFEDETTLLVEGGEEGPMRVRADAVVIATGSTNDVPEVLDPVRAAVLTNATVFEIEDLPSSLAVLGGGPVGLELAQAMARLGVRVTLVDPGEGIGGLSDPKVLAAARDALGGEFEMRLGAEVVSAEAEGAGARLTLEAGSGERRALAVERVLAAAGRPPDLGGLDLAASGLALDDHGTPVFDKASRRCGGSAVFIAGDAGHDRPVLHEATRGGRIAGRNAARCPEIEAPPRWPAFAVVYTHPEIATVGRPYDEGAVRRGEMRVGEADYGRQGRAVVDGEAAGLLRIYADRDRRVLGAQMACAGAEHLGHILTIAVQEGWDVGTMLDRPFYHPTLEEGLTTALEAIG